MTRPRPILPFVLSMLSRRRRRRRRLHCRATVLRRCQSFGKRISKAWTRCSAPSSVSGSQLPLPSLSPRHEPHPSLHVPPYSKYNQQQRLPPLHRLCRRVNAVVVHEAFTHEGCSVDARDPCDLSVLMSGDVSATSPVFVHPGRRFLATICLVRFISLTYFFF